jgi:hypothetical protein
MDRCATINTASSHPPRNSFPRACVGVSCLMGGQVSAQLPKDLDKDAWDTQDGWFLHSGGSRQHKHRIRLLACNSGLQEVGQAALQGPSWRSRRMPAPCTCLRGPSSRSNNALITYRHSSLSRAGRRFVPRTPSRGSSGHSVSELGGVHQSRSGACASGAHDSSLSSGEILGTSVLHK